MKKLSIFSSLFSLMILASCGDDDESRAAFNLDDLVGTYELVSSADEDFVTCTTGDVIIEISNTQIEFPTTDLDTGCQVGSLTLNYEFRGGNTFATDFGDYRVVSFDGTTLVWEGLLAGIPIASETLRKQ